MTTALSDYGYLKSGKKSPFKGEMADSFKSRLPIDEVLDEKVRSIRKIATDAGVNQTSQMIEQSLEAMDLFDFSLGNAKAYVTSLQPDSAKREALVKEFKLTAQAMKTALKPITP